MYDDKFIIDSLPIFTVSSDGNVKTKAQFTIKCANNIFSLLVKLSKNKFNKTFSVEDIELSYKNNIHVEELRDVLCLHGSDKSTTHNYHLVYGNLLDKNKTKKILEIGLGTNDVNIVSNMGSQASVGASVKAFRDFCPNAMVYGADIDDKITLNEERLKTYFVDQTNLESLEHLYEKVGDNFDLIIDDGLHSPDANLSVLLVSLSKLKKGGYLVIEDINVASLSIWHLVQYLVPDNYTFKLIQTKCALMFVVKRVN